MKPKYGDNTKLCYIDNFRMNIKTEDFYKDIANDVEKRFDTSNYEVNRPTGKNKKVIGLMKDELGAKNRYGICHFKTKNLFIFNR